MSDKVNKMLEDLGRLTDARLQIDVESLTYFKAVYEVQKERNEILKELLETLKELLREIKLLSIRS